MRSDKDAAQVLLRNELLPLDRKLLRFFDSTTVDGVTGNNALHEMSNFFCVCVTEWDYMLVELLVLHGVSVHERNQEGRTPLLQLAATIDPTASTSVGLQQLLKHGSDLNAQDIEGQSVLHHLVSSGSVVVLQDLLAWEGAAHLDFSLLNKAGQTACDFATVRLAELQQDEANDEKENEGHSDISDDEEENEEDITRVRQIRRIMCTQMASWKKHTRPVLLRCLETVLSVVDVAQLALGYIDGSGLPFVVSSAPDTDADVDERHDTAEATSAVLH